MWEELRGRIVSMAAFEALGRRLGGGEPVPVGGLVGSARPLVLAALLPRTGRRAVVIASDPVRARDVAEDLACFGLERVVLYPEDEMLPYDYHDPDRNLTGMQMAALEALSADRCDVLVCTVRSFLKKIFPPGTFRALLLDIGRGPGFDPWELADRLVRLGYERHQIVEGKGQFALRGGILDLFEVTAEQPVRLEFDGDEIVSLRDFDIETQRSAADRRTVRVHPLYHLVPDGAGLERLRAFLVREGARLEPGERGRALLAAERMEGGIHFFGMEHYAAVVHDVVPVTAYFPEPPVVVTIDHEDVETAMQEFREEIDRRFESSRGENLYPDPGLVFVSEDEWRTAIQPLDRIELRRVPRDDAVRFSTTAVGDFRRNITGLVADMRREIDARRRVFLFCATGVQRDRAVDILDEVAVEIDFPIGIISSGFRWPDAGVVFYSEEDGAYVADIPDSHACSAFGDTAEEALAEVLRAKEAWLATAKETGRPIPQPHYRAAPSSP